MSRIAQIVIMPEVEEAISKKNPKTVLNNLEDKILDYNGTVNKGSQIILTSKGQDGKYSIINGEVTPEQTYYDIGGIYGYFRQISTFPQSSITVIVQDEKLAKHLQEELTKLKYQTTAY